MALLNVNFFSEVLGMSMNMDVILPQQTKNQIGMTGARSKGKYPTMYLLHGMSDDHTIWQRRTSIERYVSELGIAVVMPTTHLGWYTDTTFGMDYWTFISDELPKICREFFPNMSDRPEDTLAAGLSMGGYGAWKLALGASDTFGAGASFSGALDIVTSLNSGLNAPSDKDECYWKGIFGDFDKVAGSDNDLFALAEKLKASSKPLPRLFQWCGTEDFLYLENLNAEAKMKSLGYPLTVNYSSGDHQWCYWDEQVQKALKWWLEGRNV